MLQAELSVVDVARGVAIAVALVAAAAPIPPLAWKRPYAAGAALKIKGKK